MSLILPPLRIGPLVVDPPIFSAPLAGYSGFAYRQILRELGGVGLIAAEMVSARAFVYGHRRRGELPERLWGMKEETKPLAVQIWDNDPEKMAEVGRRLAGEFGASVVDINFGCPVRDVAEKAESGAYLLRDPERIGRIVARVAKACEPTPVTSKIRLGPTRDSINAIEVARAVEEAGAAALTVHGRVAEDFFRGEADWNQIARIKPELKRIPLIGNGDLKTAEDVVSAFKRYGVDGVMIGRAGLARPWIFREAAAALRGEPIPPPPTREEQCDLIRRQFGLLVKQHGPERACTAVRAMVCWYVQGIPGARRFRTNVVKVVTPEEFYEVLERDYPR